MNRYCSFALFCLVLSALFLGGCTSIEQENRKNQEDPYRRKPAPRL